MLSFSEFGNQKVHDHFREILSWHKLVRNTSLCSLGISLWIYLRIHKNHILLFCGEKEFYDFLRNVLFFPKKTMIRKWAKLLGSWKIVSMPQACVPRGQRVLSRLTWLSICPACRFSNFTFTNLPRFPSTFGVCRADGNDHSRYVSMLTFPSGAPRSIAKNVWAGAETQRHRDWVRDLEEAWEGAREGAGARWGREEHILPRSLQPPCLWATGSGAPVLIASAFDTLDHTFPSILSLLPYLTSRPSDNLLSTAFARCSSFAHRLHQRFSPWDWLCSPGDTWQCLETASSHLGMAECSWHLRSRSQGCF